MGDKLLPTFIIEFDKETERIFEDRKEGENEMNIVVGLSRHRNDSTAFLRNVYGVVLFVRPINKELFTANVELKKKRGFEGVGKEPIKKWNVSLGNH